MMVVCDACETENQILNKGKPQEPHSAGAFEERRDLPASLQWKLELSDIMIEQLRYRHSKAHGMAARGEIQSELQQLLLERVGLDNRMANEKYYVVLLVRIRPPKCGLSKQVFRQCGQTQ